MKVDTIDIAHGIMVRVMQLEVKTKALEELLIEKGNVTMEEIEDRCTFIGDRDEDKMKMEWINLLENMSETD